MAWNRLETADLYNRILSVSFTPYIFLGLLLLHFFLIFADLWWFGVGVLGLGVLDWVFGVGIFQLMGFEACGVGPSGFFEVGSLHIDKEE